MKTLAPLLVLLAAGCSPPPPDLTPISKELASLRQGLEELKKLQQPTFDREQSMEDLAKEVRRLQDRLAQPVNLPAAPGLPALPAPQTGNLGGGVGGTQPGLNDLYWVLTRLPVENEERVVLALYQAGSRGIKLLSVRMLNADLQIVQYEGDKPQVREIIEALKKKK